MKLFALGTAFSSVLGKPWRSTVLADFIPENDPLSATFKIRVSDYPALSQPFGSVRLGVNPVRQESEPFPDGDFWPTLINRGEEGEFYVLDAECQHASCVVPAYDDFFFGIHCPCHGSTYGIDGSVVTGPTERPLRRYQFEFDGDDTLTIHVPNLGFRVTSAPVPGNGNSRLRLCFETHYGITYEVHYRARAQASWTTIPFASSAEESADMMTWFANGAPATLYVDRSGPTGFYAVSMVLMEV